MNWGTLSWTVHAPAGTGAAFFARHGDTRSPDATWTAFAPVAGSGGAIGGSSRYLQYRVDLSPRTPARRRRVEQVTIGYSEIPPNHAPVAADDSYQRRRRIPRSRLPRRACSRTTPTRTAIR